MTIYEINFYSNNVNKTLGSYKLYSDAFSKMQEYADAFYKIIKSKVYKPSVYRWNNNLLIREEYDFGNGVVEEDLYGKFELNERSWP